MRIFKNLSCGLFVLFGLAQTPSAVAQLTAFTYQGQLKEGGQPASGPHDFRIRLFGVPSGGTQIGSTLCREDVDVSNGLFEVQLDFGQQFTTLEGRYLDIQVRRDIGQPCTDDFGYVPLTPRQGFSATPIAIHSSSAFSLAASDGAPSNAVVVDANGNVGVGTIAPQAKLHLSGGDLLSGAPGEEWIFHTRSHVGGDFLQITDSENGVFQFQRGIVVHENSGVGIGTTAPQARLDVRGDIRLGSSGQFRAAAGEENLRIIRGVVNASGGISAGSGFTVSHVDEGHYTVTFNTPFSGLPSVTATGDSDGLAAEYIAETFVVTSNSASILTRLISGGGGYSDMKFNFIAVGPR